MFYALILNYASIIDCVEEPTDINTKRKRQCHNYKHIQNYFIIQGMSVRETQDNIRAFYGQKYRVVKVICGG